MLTREVRPACSPPSSSSCEAWSGYRRLLQQAARQLRSQPVPLVACICLPFSPFLAHLTRCRCLAWTSSRPSSPAARPLPKLLCALPHLTSPTPSPRPPPAHKSQTRFALPCVMNTPSSHGPPGLGGWDGLAGPRVDSTRATRTTRTAPAPTRERLASRVPSPLRAHAGDSGACKSSVRPLSTSGDSRTPCCSSATTSTSTTHARMDLELDLVPRPVTCQYFHVPWTQRT